MRTSRRIAAAALALVLGIGALVGVTPAPAGAGTTNCTTTGTWITGPVHNYLCVQNGSHQVVYRYRKDGTQIGVATDAHVRSETNVVVFAATDRVIIQWCASPDTNASTAGAPPGYSYSFVMQQAAYPYVNYAGALNIAADPWSYLDLTNSWSCPTTNGTGGFHQQLY